MRDTCNSLCIMPVLFLSALQRRLPLSTEAASFVCLLFSLFHALFSPSHGDFSLLFTAPARTTEKSTLAGVLPSDDEHALLLNSSFVSSHLYLPEEKLLQPGLPQVSGESGATENYSHTKGRGGENVSSSVDSRRAGAKDDLHGKETGRSSGLSSLSTQKESLSQQPLSASSLREDVENTFLNKQVSLVSPRALPAPQSSLSAATPSDLSISLRGNTQPQDLSLAQRGDIIDWRYLLFRRLHSFPSSPSLSSALVPFYDEAETGLYPGDVAAAYISSVAEERRKKVPREINTWRDMGVVEGENVDSSPQIVSPVIMEETQETRLPSFCSDTPGGHTPGQVRKDCFALHQRGEGKVSGGDECMFQEEGNRVLCITREDNTTSVDEPQLKPSQLQLKDIFVVPPGVHTAGDTEQKAVSFSKKHFQLSPEPSLALLSPAKREQQKRALLRILTRETQRGVSSRKFLTLTEGISGSVPRGSLAGTGRQDDFSSDEDIQWLWVVALEGPAIFRFLGWADEDQGEDDKAVATEASGLQDGVCANPDVFLKAFPFWTSAEGEQKQYELFSKLGKGSYGEVWAALALDTQAEHRYVVLKRMLHPKDDRGKRIRLSGEREIFFGQMLAGTPQIARFLEAFTLPTDGGSGVRTRDGVGDARGGKHGKGSKTSRGSDETCAGMCHQDKQGSEQRRRRGWFFSKKARVNFKQERMRKEKDKEKEDLWLVFVNEGYSLSHLFFSPDEQRGGLLTPSDLWWLLKRGKDSKKNSPDEGTNKDDGVNTGPTAAERMSTSSSSSSSFGGSKRKKPSPFQAFYDTFAQGAAAPDFLILLRALMRQLLVALAKAHSFHITHRDVKPENILLRPSLPLDVRLADWGSAILHADHHNTTAVETFLDLMAPGEPSADQETRGYQPPETFASFPPLSSFFHKEKDPRTRAQSRQSRDEAPKEMNGELVGVKVPRSSTLPDGGDIQEGTKKIVVEGVSAKTTGEKGRKTEDSDRGRERDKGHEGSIGSKEDRREKMKGEFWRPAAYDVWGAGLTMLKIVLGDLEPLTVQDDRIRSKLERRFADQPAGVRDKALLYQALADLCLIPWIQDHSPSLSTPTHVAASKSFSKKKIDRTSSSEHIFPPLLPSTDLLSLSNTDDRGKGVVPSAVEEGVQSSNRETDSSSMDSTSSHTTVIGKSALSPSISGLTSPLTTATSHEWTFPNTLHSLFSFGMFTSFFLKVASSFCFATEDYLPDFLCRVCKKVLSRSREHVCDQDFASQRERHEGRKEGREEHSQAYGYDWQQRGGAQADLRNFLALVQQSTEDDEKQLQSTLLTKRQAKSLTVSPSSHQREICRVSGLPRTTGSPRSKAGPPSVCRCPSSTEKRDVIKKDGREEGEEAKLFTLVNDGSTVEESPCVRISSSYEDIDNDVEGDLTREKRRVSGFQRKQDAVYLLPDPEESEGKRYEIAISDGCIEDGSTRQVAMDKGVREEAVILRSQSQSLIVAEKQAGREIVETSDFALEEKEAGRRYERSERQRLESRGSLDSRTKGPSESEQGLGKAGEEQDERRRRTNMKIKRQKHNPDACDDKLFARLLRERDKANVGLPNALARDLLRKLLAFDPQERISAEEAVRHPWFAVSPGVAGSQYHELFSQEREKEENDEGEEDEELESRSDRS